MDISDFNITIVGLGLIGGSYAMALKELKPRNLWAVDIDKKSIEIAEKNKIIQRGYLKPEIPLGNSDLVIICLYPNQVAKFIRDNLGCFKSGAIITDVAGIKSKIIGEINSFIPESLDFISGHPMAGNEHRGICHAAKEIFKNANYIITPHSKNKGENVEFLEALALKIGCKNVVKVTPEKHDRIIALTSHLTHVIAVSLVNSNILDIDTKQFIGGSFKDASRVALINSQLWPQLLVDNKENIVEQIEIFEENLRNIKEAIFDGNMVFLEKEFKAASQRRRELI